MIPFREIIAFGRITLRRCIASSFLDDSPHTFLLSRFSSDAFPLMLFVSRFQFSRFLFVSFPFLDASSHLYKRVSLSVRPSVRPSVGP